jgi:GNAT superfamily N-acetyltransferase
MRAMRATRTYLEMRDPAALRPSPMPADDVRIERVHRCPASFYRYLYAAVGGDYKWVDRLTWGEDQVLEHVAREDIEIWLLSSGGAPAGYFELQRYASGSCEIAYFGLLPDVLGRGLGGWLLTEAVRAAWSLGPTRVWLHTSSLDHPAALANYRARGFEIVRTEDYAVPD